MPTREAILTRLVALWDRIDAEPKSSRWRRRNRLGERKALVSGAGRGLTPLVGRGAPR
jgi:hypothetical protein